MNRSPASAFFASLLVQPLVVGMSGNVHFLRNRQGLLKSPILLQWPPWVLKHFVVNKSRPEVSTLFWLGSYCSKDQAYDGMIATLKTANKYLLMRYICIVCWYIYNVWHNAIQFLQTCSLLLSIWFYLYLIFVIWISHHLPTPTNLCELLVDPDPLVGYPCFRGTWYLKVLKILT